MSEYELLYKLVEEEVLTEREAQHIEDAADEFDQVNVAHARYGCAVQIWNGDKQASVRSTESGYEVSVPNEQLPHGGDEGTISIATADQFYTAFQEAKDNIQP